MMNKEKTQPVYKIKWLLLPLVVAAILMSFNMKRAIATNVDFAVNSEIIELEPIVIDDTVVSAVPAASTGHVIDDVNSKSGYTGIAISANPDPKKAVIITKGSDTVDIANADLLFIIDGKESSGAEFLKLGINTIRSINLFNDDTIEAYGDKGKNGVIIVETKDYRNSSGLGVSGFGNEAQKHRMSQSYATTRSTIYHDTTSFSESKALFIIDGKESDKSKLSKLDTKEIHSFSVLKKGSATRLYGDKGKNGVIIVETKSSALNQQNKALNEQRKEQEKALNEQKKEQEKALNEQRKEQEKALNEQKKEQEKAVEELIKEQEKTLDTKSQIIINGKKSNPIILSKLKPDDIESIGSVGRSGKNNMFTIGTKDNVIISESDETSDTKCLFIIDGKEASKDDLSKLETNVIKSLSILKSKTAIKEYGDKGKNGVIVIETKTE
jgi:TonB-dependent SusC/RagA subfamily outer membrane receptor